MRNSKKILTIAMLAALGAGSAQASLINAGFETGDLTGWTSSLSNGAATVVTSNSTDYFTPATYLPQYGNYFLAIQSGDQDVWQTVFQSLSVGAGETVSGMAAFDWGDYLTDAQGSYPDGARVRILDAAGALVATPFYMDGLLTPGAAADKVEGGSASGFNGPWTDWSWTAATAGTYTVEFAARNTGDGGGPNQTFGLFDAPGVVPEPASLALLGLGLIGLGAMRRRKTV